LKNIYLDGRGHLVIKATKGSNAFCGFAPCQYTSGGLSMIDWSSGGEITWSQEYGTFAARIKVPAGSGLWPGFWLAGSNGATVQWPLNGEIDIMEVKSQQPRIIDQFVEGGSPELHTGVFWKLPPGQSAHQWHVYEVSWTPAGIRWLVDGHVTEELSAVVAGAAWAQSFEHPFDMVLDLTVGGDLVGLGLPDAHTKLPASMLVDWIRVTRY
jgi:beta-glucanase (GH16 family)